MRLPSWNPEGFWRLTRRVCESPVCKITQELHRQGLPLEHNHAALVGRREAKRMRRAFAAARG